MTLGRTRLDWKLASAQHAFVRERLIKKRLIKARRKLACKAAAVHRVNPYRIDLFDPIDDLPYWRFMGENPDPSVQRKHLQG